VVSFTNTSTPPELPGWHSRQVHLPGTRVLPTRQGSAAGRAFRALAGRGGSGYASGRRRDGSRPTTGTRRTFTIPKPARPARTSLLVADVGRGRQ
jgi:hypothetical protein